MNEYGGRLPKSFLLKFRNGYELPVDLNDDDWTMYGFSTLYEDFGLNGGEMLLFEFTGKTDFNVYVIGSNLTEIKYPNIVHYLQKNRPRVGKICLFYYIILTTLLLFEYFPFYASISILGKYFYHYFFQLSVSVCSQWRLEVCHFCE